MAITRVCVVEKIMQPQCNVQDQFVFVLRMLSEKQRRLRALRSERQSTRRKRACVRRGIPTYRYRSSERPRREPWRRVETPFNNFPFFHKDDTLLP